MVVALGYFAPPVAAMYESDMLRYRDTYDRYSERFTAMVLSRCGVSADMVELDKREFVGGGDAGVDYFIEGMDDDDSCAVGESRMKEEIVGVPVGEATTRVEHGLEHEVSGTQSVQVEAALTGAAKGRHYKRNKAKALRRKRMGQAMQTSTVFDDRRGPESDRAFATCDAAVKSGVEKEGGYFRDCSEDVRVQLRDSRARMLIAKNEAEEAKARSSIRHHQMVKESRSNETWFELRRQSSEEKLRKISEKRLGVGYVEGTIYSTTAASSLSSGSVSPNSSISMAELKRREDMYRAMEKKVVEVTLENKKLIQEKKELAKEKALSAPSSFVSGSVRLFLSKEEEDLILDERRVKKERMKHEKFCEVTDYDDY